MVMLFCIFLLRMGLWKKSVCETMTMPARTAAATPYLKDCRNLRLDKSLDKVCWLAAVCGTLICTGCVDGIAVGIRARDSIPYVSARKLLPLHSKRILKRLSV